MQDALKDPDQQMLDHILCLMHAVYSALTDNVIACISYLVRALYALRTEESCIYIKHKQSVFPSQYTHQISIMEINQTIFFRKIIAFIYENFMKHKYMVWIKCR
jgi:hypothetical protein